LRARLSLWTFISSRRGEILIDRLLFKFLSSDLTCRISPVGGTGGGQ